MTIKEKRKMLGDWCKDQSCMDDVCPLHIPGFRCGRGQWFYGGSHGMSDADVTRAYDIVFANHRDTPSTVDHPGHYNREGSMECIDEMLLIFGKEAVIAFCLCNAWKYRYRAVDKNGAEDLKKADWYLAKYRELKGGD